MSHRLADKHALVTGASRGIGRAIAVEYARQGATLFLTATNEVALQETASLVREIGAEVTCHIADLGNPTDIETMFAAAVAWQKELNVLVNNAGIYIGKPFTAYDMDEFDRLMKVNVYSVFQLTQLALRHMQPISSLGKQSKIVNIASTAGKWESANQAAYNTTKHAVVGMTRCAALENGSRGINVNAICPGMVETDMFNEFDVHAKATGITLDELRTAASSRIPIGRFLQPDEIAQLAVYLASQESDGMTGQTLTISGGMRMG